MVLQNPGWAGLSLMPIDKLHGLPKYNHRSPSVQQRQSILLCPLHYERLFLQWSWQRSYMMSSNLLFFVQTVFFAMGLRWLPEMIGERTTTQFYPILSLLSSMGQL